MGYDPQLKYSIRCPPPGTGQDQPLLILLHGFMENEGSMKRVADHLHGGFRVVSVRAPIQIGERSYGWARARFTPRGPEECEEEFEASRRTLLRFLEAIQGTHGSNHGPVYVMGFSQGASLCLALAVTEGERLAGAVALGGKLLEPYSGARGAQVTMRIPTIFVAHGTDDEVVPITKARADAARLRELQPGLVYREYAVGHEIGEAALEDATAWLYARKSP